MTIKEFKTEIENNYFLNDHLDIEYLFENSEADSIDELRDEVIKLIHGCEITYFSVAIEYLAENDPSLQESLEIAGGLGYTPSQLNSEHLATLHLQDRLETELFEIH